MKRTQFTFYISFHEALRRIRNKSDRCDAYDAICAYALYGTEPDTEKLRDAAAIAFALIRPTLDSAARKAKGGMASPLDAKEAGKTGARSGEDSGKEKEIENETEKEKEYENEYETDRQKDRQKEPPAAGDTPASLLFLQRRPR